MVPPNSIKTMFIAWLGIGVYGLDPVERFMPVFLGHPHWV